MKETMSNARPLVQHQSQNIDMNVVIFFSTLSFITFQTVIHVVMKHSTLPFSCIYAVPQSHHFEVLRASAICDRTNR